MIDWALQSEIIFLTISYNIKSTIDRMISSNRIIVLSFMVCMCLGQLCPQPQKTFYMSYNAISNHDYLATLFQNISSSFSLYNTTYTDNDGTIYSIVNFKQHLYYNQHRQVQFWYDQLSVNVTLGQLYMSYNFNMSIQQGHQVIAGWARGRTLVDDYSFLKRLFINQGGLQWDPYNITPLQINSQFSVQYSNPKLTIDQTTIYLQLLNDHLGNGEIKKNTIQKMNDLFEVRLKYHLNHQTLMKDNIIQYKYGNITLNYVNAIRQFKMNNAKTKGLMVALLFGFAEGKQQCIDLPNQFDEESYGGVQEIISISQFKATLERVAAMGLFNQVLDKKYQVPYFQFYMGDLANFVEYAEKLPAHDPLIISCMFSSQRADELKLKRFDQHEVFVQIPEECSVSYKQSIVMKVSFDMNLVLRLNAGPDSLSVSISNAVIFGDKYISVDPKFVVTNPYIARYSVSALVKGMIGRTVFGTGWPTFVRKYPVLRVLEDYVVIFDASQY